MLQLFEIKEQESYIHLIDKLNKNFDIIALSSGGSQGQQGERGIRGLIGANGIRGLRFFNEGSDLTESIKGDWLIMNDGTVKVKDSNGHWNLIENFSLKGARGLQGESGETSELNRHAGTFGDEFYNESVYSPNKTPTILKSPNNRDFITLKRKQDVFVIGDVPSIKSKFANFPTESQTPSLIIIQNDILPNGKNGISIGANNITNDSTPNLATSDFKNFANLYIDYVGDFQIQKDFGNIGISSKDSINLASNNEYLVVGKKTNRGIFANGENIELTTTNSSIKQYNNVEIKNNSTNILILNGKTISNFGDKTNLKIRQQGGDFNVSILKIQNTMGTNGFGVAEYNGYIGKIQLNYSNSPITGSMMENVIQRIKPIYFSKNGSLLLTNDENNVLNFATSLPDSSIQIDGILKLNKGASSDFNAKYVPLSDEYGNITLYDENGQITRNSNIIENGFRMGMFYKSNDRGIVKLVSNIKLEIGGDRSATELTYGLSIKSNQYTNSLTPSILLASSSLYNPFIEFNKGNDSANQSKLISFGKFSFLTKRFDMNSVTGLGGVLTTLSDPLENFSDSWRILEVKKYPSDDIVEDFKLKKIGGLPYSSGNVQSTSKWYKTLENDSTYFDFIKVSNGRTFQFNSNERICPYSKISIQRLGKEIWFLNFSITIISNVFENVNIIDKLDFFEIEISERIGIMKPMKSNRNIDLDYDGHIWLPCTIYKSNFIDKPISSPIDWNNGIKKFVTNENNHTNLNSDKHFKGNFTLDRIGNNKTAIQFSFESISKNDLWGGVTFSASTIVFGYREKQQLPETFDSFLYDEEE